MHLADERAVSEWLRTLEVQGISPDDLQQMGSQHHVPPSLVQDLFSICYQLLRDSSVQDIKKELIRAIAALLERASSTTPDTPGR